MLLSSRLTLLCLLRPPHVARNCAITQGQLLLNGAAATSLPLCILTSVTLHFVDASLPLPLIRLLAIVLIMYGTLEIELKNISV